MVTVDETQAPVWNASEVSVSIDGTEVDAYNSFVYEGDEDLGSHIECTTGTAGYQYKGPKPKATLKVKTTCSALPHLYELRDAKTQVPITYSSPVKTANLISAVIQSIKDGEDSNGAPETTVEILAMKIVTSRK